MDTKSMVRNMLFLSAFLGAAVLPYQEVIAQGDRPMSTPDTRVSRELWDVWRQGFDYYEKGEMKMISCKYEESLLYYQKSLDAFTEVRRQNPRWNRSVIDYRMNLCRRRILTARRRAREQAEEKRQALARSRVDLKGSTVQASSSAIPGSSSVAAAAGRDFEVRLARTTRENELRRKQIADLQAELARLRPNAARADSAVQQIRSLMRERDQLDKQLSSLRLQFQSLQNEQKKSAPRNRELQKLLDAERSRSNVYARSYRERAAAYNKLEEQFKILSAGKNQLDEAHSRLSRQYAALQKSTTDMVRQNASSLESMSRQLTDARKEVASRENAMAKLRQEMQKVSAELRSLRSGKLSSEENARQIRNEMTLLRAEQEKSRAELEKLRADRIRLENQCVLLNSQITSLKKDLAVNMEQRNDFSKANDAISKQFAALDKSFRKSVAENASLRKELAKAVRERELFASKVNDQLNESLKESLRSSRSEVQRLKNELESLKKQGNALELKASLVMAQSKLLAGDQAQASLRGQIAALNERSQRTAKELSESQKLLKESREQLARNRSEQEKLQSEIASLRESNRLLSSGLKEQTESALKNMQSLRRQESSARAALDEALKRQIALNESSNTQLNSSRKTISQLTETLRIQNERLAKVLAESEVLKQQKNLLQSRIAQEKLLAETRSSQFKLQSDALTRKNTELLAALREKELRVASLQKELKNAAKGSAASGKENRALQKELASLREKIRILSEKEANSVQKTTDASARIAVLSAALIAAQKKSADAEHLAAQSQEKIRTLTLELDRVRKDLSSRQKSVAAVVKPSPEKNRILQLEQELAVLRRNAEFSSGKTTSDQQKIASLERELASLRKELSAGNKRAESFAGQKALDQQKIASLERELTSLRKELSAGNKRAESFAGQKALDQQKIASLEQESASLRKELVAAQKKSLDLSGKVVAENSRMIRLQEELLQARKEVVQLSGENTQNRKKITDLQMELTSLRKDLDSARKDAAGISGNAASAKAQVHALQGKLASALEISRVREQELKALRAELERTRMEFASLKSRSERSEAESGKELALLRKQAYETPLQIAAQRKALEEKNKELDNVQKSLQENTRILADRDKEILKLKEQIRTLQNTLIATGSERSALVKDLEKLRKDLPRKEVLFSARKKITEVENANTLLRKEKASLEQTISSLQFRLGSTQSLLEKVRKEALRQGEEIGELKNRNRALQSQTVRAGSLEKSLASAREERNRLLRSSAAVEKRLKDQLRQYAAEILTVRDASVQQKETLRLREKKIASLQKELKDSSARIAVLQKKLAEALSGEERRQLVKQIESLTGSMKVLASSSADELVREAANKNLVITELLGEIQGYKGQLKTMKEDVERNRLAVLRSRDEILQAQEGARLAVEGARLARAELAVLKAEVLSGSVNVTLLERSAPKVQLTPKGKIVPRGGAVSVSDAEKVRKPSRERKKTADSGKAVKASSGVSGEKKSVAEKKEFPAKYQEAMKQALTCEKSGDLGMALFHCWSAVDLLPDHPDPYLYLAKLHLKRKEAESARKAYNKAVSLGAVKDPVLDSQIRLLVEQEE